MHLRVGRWPYARDLAFPGIGDASVGFGFDAKRFGHESIAKVLGDGERDLHDFLCAEKFTQLIERGVTHVATMGHLFHISQHGPLFLIEQG